jgi:hypothetical protein
MWSYVPPPLLIQVGELLLCAAHSSLEKVIKNAI